MMKQDYTSGTGDFSTVAPRILNEKINIQEEVSNADWEERSLLRNLADLQFRIAQVGKRRQEAEARLANNDELSKYWIINRTTLVAQTQEAEKVKTLKKEEVEAPQ